MSTSLLPSFSLASSLVGLMLIASGCTFGKPPGDSGDSSVDSSADADTDIDADTDSDSDSDTDTDTDTDSDTDTSSACPAMTYSPTSLAFDGGAIGQTYDQTITITDTCTTGDDLDVLVTLSPARGPFSRISGAEMIIPPGTSADITIEYTPDHLDPDQMHVDLTTNDPAQPTVEITVTGTPDADIDNDGHDSDTTRRGDDCDDSNPAVYPGATEIWYDGIDEDCSGGSDYDQDGDGVDSVTYGGTDCDDTNPAVTSGC